MSFFSQVIQLLVFLFAPLVVFAVVIHFIEQLIQRRLSRRFGWASVMWTGWLGAPVHELSHALMCIVFRHRIEDMALFQPDRQEGRLGFVRHAYERGNWFQELGNPFIGMAPLVGGTLVMWGLLVVLFPEVIGSLGASEESTAAGGDSLFDWLGQQWSTVVLAVQGIFSVENVTRIRFWIFLYLVLCVASHMAPSTSDYRGAGLGGIALIGLIVAGVALVVAVVPDPLSLATEMAAVLAPLYAVLAVATALCIVSVVVVFAITAIWDLVVG